MTDNTVYLTDKGKNLQGKNSQGKISQGKMQFYVINRRPEYSPQEKEIVKAGIEKQLFKVFCKYV